LNRSQAARIAAILPNPKVYKADNPGPYVQKRAAWIERQMRNLGGASHVKKKQ
jgi:monofunctional biosynthetic peptidoglycan transglycosylase